MRGTMKKEIEKVKIIRVDYGPLKERKKDRERLYNIRKITSNTKKFIKKKKEYDEKISFNP